MLVVQPIVIWCGGTDCIFIIGWFLEKSTGPWREWSRPWSSIAYCKIQVFVLWWYYCTMYNNI